MIDFLSLRAREYAFLTRMFEEWEVSCQHTTPVRDEAELRDTLFLGLSPPSWAGGRQLCHRAWGFCNWLSPLGLSHGQAGIWRLSEQPLEAEVFSVRSCCNPGTLQAILQTQSCLLSCRGTKPAAGK